jgi:hypothetical protein
MSYGTQPIREVDQFGPTRGHITQQSVDHVAVLQFQADQQQMQARQATQATEQQGYHDD